MIWRATVFHHDVVTFWYHFCATFPLKMRSVGLVIFLQAFALLSVLYCLPAIRHADQVFSPAVCHNCLDSWCSVWCHWIVHHPYPHPPPLTGATLGKICWILVLHPHPLLALSLPCWLCISDTWALPAINHENCEDRGVAGMNRRRSMWESMAVTDLSVNHPSTSFLRTLTT